jgi:hypothetical protein
MRRLKIGAALVVGLLLAACQGRVSEPVMASVNVAPVASGLARVYFYRDWEPYESLARPRIYLNDAPTEISEPGGISIHDLPSGEYHISVDSQGIYPHQFKTLFLRPGDIRYVKIESLRSWYRDSRLRDRDTFVVELIPERQAKGEIGDMRYMPGAS